MNEETRVDEAFYLAANPDVRRAVEEGHFASGQQHYDLAGRREGRLPRPDRETQPLLLNGRHLALVINLRGDRPRYDRLTEDLAGHDTLVTRRVEAVYGSSLPDDVCRRLTNDPNSMNAKGALGCFLSHVRAWEMLLALDVPHAFIMEDDTVPTGHAWPPAGDMPPNYDLLFANDRCEPVMPSGAAPAIFPVDLALRALLVRGCAVGADCYMLSRAGARKLIDFVAADVYFGHVDLRLMAYSLDSAALDACPIRGPMHDELRQIQAITRRRRVLNAGVFWPALARHAPGASSRVREDGFGATG